MCYTISLIITIYQPTTWNELIFAQRVVPVIHLPISIETLHYNQRNKLKKICISDHGSTIPDLPVILQYRLLAYYSSHI